jgi:CheY-like chemotaxis protein
MAFDRRILIADDDREQRAGVVELVSGLGAEVLEAETGTEALSILRRWRLALALLDFHMPGHTGLELLSFIRNETLGTPCILLSGEANDIVRKSALQEGALAVLKKPFEPATLRAEVRRALALVDGANGAHGPDADGTPGADGASGPRHRP